MLTGLTLFTVFLYVIGLALLLIEALVPGFGVAGVIGVACVIASIAMIASNPMEAILILIATAAVIILLILGLYKLGFGKKYVKHFVLKEEQKNEAGYVSTNDYKRFIGMKGVALTILRPAGTVLIENEKLDAVTEGGFISRDSEIEVIKVEGRRVIVRSIK